jgi:hypothetical protein
MPQRRNRHKGLSRNNVRNRWSGRSRKSAQHLSRPIIRHPLRKKRHAQRRNLPITLLHRHIPRLRRTQRLTPHRTLHRSRSSTMITITTANAHAA